MGLTAAVIRLLNDIERDFHVDVVIGPFFEDTWRIENEVGRAVRSVHIFRDPESIVGLMERADIACAGGGQTLFELAATGCPTVAVGYVENQRRNIDALAGAILPVWLGENDCTDSIKDAIELLLTDTSFRIRLSEGALALVDGRGSERVADQMIALAHSFRDVSS